MDIKEAREQIHQIDTAMAELFVRRMNAVREVAAYKQEHGLPIEDRKQEARVIEAHSSEIGDETMRSYYIQFLQNTMEISKRWQHHLTC